MTKNRRDSLLMAFVLVLTITVPGTVLASVDDCIRLESDLDRLACYDRASGRIPKTEKIDISGSAWRVVSEVSKLTDDPTVTLMVRTPEAVSCGFRRPQPMSLYLRCMENTTSLFFAGECHLTSSDYNDYGHVDIRLDNDKSFTSRMKESTDNKALGLWNGAASIPVIKKMFGKNRLVARMTPFNESPITIEMDVTGLDAAIDPLRKACGW